MNAQKQPDKDSTWQRTPFADLLRYKPSQVYFARLKIKGKLIRRSLKTNKITAAKLRLADLEKIERQKVQSVNAVANGKMTFGDALVDLKKRLEENPSVKPKAKEYYGFRIHTVRDRAGYPTNLIPRLLYGCGLRLDGLELSLQSHANNRLCVHTCCSFDFGDVRAFVFKIILPWLQHQRAPVHFRGGSGPPEWKHRRRASAGAWRLFPRRWRARGFCGRG